MSPFEISDLRIRDCLLDDSIEDLLLKPRLFAAYKNGAWQGPFESESCSRERLWNFARALAEDSSLTLSLTQPTVDALWFFSAGNVFRAFVAIEPFVEEGPEICLRRIGRAKTIDVSSFFEKSDDESRVKEAYLRGDSILIAGPTGSGKSTLLSSLLALLPSTTRTLLLEDTKELPIPNALSSRLLSRSDTFGFREGVSWGLSDLLRESMRMRPERLVLGECRGPEAAVIYQALMTGHRGVTTTIHAGSITEACARFNHLAKIPPEENPWDWILIIGHKNGRRQVIEIVQVRPCR